MSIEINKQKEYLTISEISRLCNIPVATLKYYDRIDLLKPDRVDENNQYRYYSVFQYEQIETIRELRELGLSIVDIRKYMNERNINKSSDILKRYYYELSAKIDELIEIQENLQSKIKLLENVHHVIDGHIRKEIYPERKILIINDKNMQDLTIRTTLESCYGILGIESFLDKTEKSATLASGRLGMYTPKKHILAGDLMLSVPFLFVENTNNESYLKTLPQSEYLCLMHRGELSDRKNHLKQLLAYIKENNYEMISDIVHISLADDMITDKTEEYVFDIQVAVKKSQL